MDVDVIQLNNREIVGNCINKVPDIVELKSYCDYCFYEMLPQIS